MSKVSLLCVAIAWAWVTMAAVGVTAAKESDAWAEVDMSRIRSEHPRLLLLEDDFDAIRERVASDPLARRWYREVRASAQQILHQPASRYEVPDGLRLLQTSKAVLDRVLKLALMYRLDGDTRYADRAWQELEAAASFPDWNPRHFLDTAEMMSAFAIGYDWLYDCWAEPQRLLLHRAIREQGLEPANLAYQGQAPRNWSSWVGRTNNWNIVCNGGVAMGALAIGDEVPELASALLRSSLQSVVRAASRFAPDGGWDEGLVYWHYSIQYLVYYVSSLCTALGTDLGLAEIPGLAEAGQFPMYLTGPSGKVFNFGDSGAGAIGAPELFWLAQRYDSSGYAWWQAKVATSGSSSSPANLFWYDPERFDDFSVGDLALDKHFRNVEVATLRSNWADPNAIFLGFKAGDNNASHGDLDQGSFVLEALGLRWAEDLGAEDYGLPGYFGDAARWTYYRKRAEGHNTLVINPGKSPDQDPLAHSRVVFTAFSPNEAVAVADLTPAYRSFADTVRRGVALTDGRQRVLIQDEVRAGEPVEIWWFMHTRADIAVNQDGRSAILTLEGKELEARILTPTDAVFQVLPAEPLATSPNPPDQKSNIPLRKLAICLDGVTDLRLVVQFIPRIEGVVELVAPGIVALDEWVKAKDGPIWPPLHRAGLKLQSPKAQSTVTGEVPVMLDLVLPPNLRLSNVEVSLEGEIIFAGPSIPEDLRIDTKLLEDGNYVLSVRLLLDDGTEGGLNTTLSVANQWTLSDEFYPPLQSIWLGMLDRKLTVAESSGWQCAQDSPEDFAGDAHRRVRSANTEEYLTWQTLHLQRASIRLYSPRTEVSDLVKLEVADAEQTWQRIPFNVKVTELPSAWMALDLEVDVPAGLDVHQFRLTLLKSELHELHQVQLGRVDFTGWTD